MDEMKRPGALTALAVINFIFAAISLLGAVGILFAKYFISNMPLGQLSEQQAAQAAVMQNMSGTIVAIIVCMNIVFFLLLLLSGVGYLKLKRVLGRFLGTIYGAAAIIFSILSTVVFPDLFGKNLGIGTMLGLIYPVLTLILLNTVFRKHLVH